MNASRLDTCVAPWRHRALRRGPASRSRDGIRFVELPEATIRCRIVGERGPTLLFCVDPPVVIELYDALIAELARDHRVVVFEPPAFGHSLPRPSLHFELPALGDVIRRFIEALPALGAGPLPYTLAFPCVTAYPALWLAARHPQLVGGLLLAQAPDWSQALAWKARRDPSGLLGTPLLGQLALKLVKRRRVAAWYATSLGRRELLAPFTAQTQAAFDHGACFCLASAFQRLLAGDQPPFGSVTQPALLFWGCDDRSHAGTDRASLLRQLPQARLIEWQGIGHFPELEAPQRYAAAVRDAGF